MMTDVVKVISISLSVILLFIFFEKDHMKREETLIRMVNHFSRKYSTLKLKTLKSIAYLLDNDIVTKENLRKLQKMLEEFD